MGLKADADYPTLDEICEDYTALRIISPAYAGREGELTAILQYVYQSIVFSELGKRDSAHLLMQIAVTEMHHLEILGSLIAKLGAPPVFTKCPPYPVGYYSASNVNYSKSPETMLSVDIAGERCAIAAYEGMCARLTNGRVKAVIERIVEDERVHLKALEAELKKLR